MKIILLPFIFLFGIVNGQNTVSGWSTLSKVSYKKAYDDLLGIAVDKPIFSSEVKKLEGQSIRLRGYIIPTDGFKSHKEFVFSAYPYSSCFFCGQAGPETVIEIQAEKPIEFSADIIELEGKLHLNSSDINRLMYQLTEAKRIF